MWSLIDNLGAVAVAGLVTLVLVAVHFMGGRAQVASVQRASARPVVAQTTDWLERDLANLGFDTNAPAILAYAWSSTGGSMTFVTMSDTTAAAHADTVRYVYRAAGSERSLERFVVRRGVATRTADAGPALHGLSIALKTANGRPVGTALDQTARVDVTLSMRPPLQAQGRPLVWEQQIYPPNLGRASS